MSDADHRPLSALREQVTRELISAESADDLRESVCERFAELDWIAFAWMGSYDASEEYVRPSAASGVPVDDIGVGSRSSGTPRQRVVGRALDAQSVQVEQDIQDDPPSGDWATHADTYGYRSVVVVPLLDGDGEPTDTETDSVLYLAVEDSDGLGERERESLASIGATVAFALADAESSDSDELDRGKRDQAVRESEQRLRAIFDGTYEYIGLLDPDGTLLDANQAALEWEGATREDVIGEPFWNSPWFAHTPGVPERIRDGVERAADGEFVRRELQLQDADGNEATFDFSLCPVWDANGEVMYLVPEGRDITERKEFEHALTNLHDVSRDLVHAETRREVSHRTVDAAAELLDFEGIGVYLFDDCENALWPVASSEYLDDVFGGAPPTFSTEETSITWQAFIDGETKTHDDILETDAVHRRDTALRSGIWVPLSDHGVLVLLTEDVGGFDEQTERLADHLAATVEATLDRVEREEALREQETELERRNEQLERLNRTNDIIRDVDQALVEATTREAIEQAVCGLLTRDDRFALAWIGEHGDDAVTPRTWAGDEHGYLDDVSLEVAGGGEPAVETAASGDTTVVSNVASNLRGAPWRKAALSRDLQSVVSIPLQYSEMDYGVLTVYDTEPNAFDDLSETVLRELGETIANAMNFVDTRRALLSDSVVELELVLEEPDDPLVRVARETGCEFEFGGIVHQSAGAARVFVTARDADVDDVREAAEESARIEHVNVLEVGEDGDHRLELEVAGATIPTTVVECGGVAQSVEIGDEVRVVVELPQSTGVRTFVDRLENRYPGTELVARRDRERTDQSQQAFETSLTERLTTRQLEALQTAYLSGYFEWPRDRTGEEVAAALDITQPTFNGHLRAAERKLCAALFDGQQPSTE